MLPADNMINITTATASANPGAWSAQNRYVDLGYPPGCAAPPMATWMTNGSLITQLSEADKEALRTMIREEICACIKDIAAEAVREINRQLRAQSGQCRSS